LVSEDVPTVPGDFTAGSRIAGYLLEEQIGRGGMAVVFRAVDERLQRQVALKILAPALAADELFRQRFIRESRAAAAADNPHIIPVYEAGEAGGILYIAMLYVRGGDLRSLVTRLGPLPPERVAEMIAQVASALDAAHERGLVHRDVKPANMLLDASGGAGQTDHVYLSDFGLTKAALSASGLTGTGMFIGTLDYIAPEQIQGRPVDGRTDQYALACAAFELLTGAPPFSRETAIAVMYAQMSELPPAPTSRRPDLQPAVDEVFFKALAKDPADRYATCREFSEAMREALGIRPRDSGQRTGSRADRSAPGDEPATDIAPLDLRDTKRRPDQAPESAAPTVAEAGRRRSPAVLIGAVAGLLVLGGGGAYFALGGKATPNASSAFPGCTTAVASAKTLSVPTHITNIPSGNPYGLQLPASGKYVFVSTPTGVSVLVRGAGTAITKHYDYTLTNDQAQRPKGMILTADGQFLLVAVGNGIDVMKVASLERDAAKAQAGTLTVPDVTGYGGAVALALSPDGHYVFLTMQYANEMAVFNLQQAEGSGFTASSYVGAVKLHLRPIGITASPDGQWLYVTSLAESHLASPAQGLINVLNLAKAEKDPASSVVSWTQAGCNPGRAITSPDGKIVWVTARNGDDVLAFSAERLRTDPRRAFLVSVLVGKTPVGEILVNGGTRLIVANTDIARTSPKADNLAVVDVRAALAGKPALLGYISSGQMPREFGVVPGGQYLLVSDNNSAQIQWIDLTKLP
jgi:serine/threonine protein kinase/DNA-binding beta-propeller fold protein YncE